MLRKKTLILAIASAVAAVGTSSLPIAQEQGAQDGASIRVKFPREAYSSNAHVTDQLIVRLRSSETETHDLGNGARRTVMSAHRSRSLAVAAQTALESKRVMGDGAHVMKLDRAMPLSDVQAIAARLARDPNVESVEPDGRRYAMQADPDIGRQWNLTSTGGGLNAIAAWGNGTSGASGATGGANAVAGTPAVIVAVLDTGVVFGSLDLAGRLLNTANTGYDMISADISSAFGAFATAGDGDGRDSNAADPGNWVTSAQAGQPPFQDCAAAVDSDWHGTHTSGIIAANRNNGLGIAGVAYQTSILPVRVLGRCGGYTSDIADGIRYAAGLTVGSIPVTTTPAKIINLSLGGSGGCSAAEQAAITAALTAGVKAIVAAAGNGNGANASTVAPANCTGVITVSAVDRNGARAPYSNIGATVAIAAPGGTFPSTCTATSTATCVDGILSTFNGGATVPVADPVAGSYAYVIGTSEAAAHVSGVAALMLSVKSTLTPQQVKSLMQSSAKASSCGCECGSGIVDANAAVAAARAAPASTGTTVSVGGGCDPAPAAASSGGGGGGGGGCAMDPNGRPDYLLAMLALIALVGVTRRRRTARVSR